MTDWLLPRRLGFVDVRNRTGTPDHRGHWEDWCLFHNRPHFHFLFPFLCVTAPHQLIQPPGVRVWSQFLLHPSCHFLQVYDPALLHRCWKPASTPWGSRGVLKKVALHLSAFVLSALFPHLCLGSVEGINDLRWDLPSTAPTSCNTAFALVLSDVGSSTVHPNQVFPGT